MDTEKEQTSEVTTEVPTGSESVAAAAGSTDSGVELTVEGKETGVTEEKPAYVPNYKLKVYDEEKELEDKFLKDLIKDAESEKKVKEIAQKYLGFDVAKSKHERVGTEYETYKKNAEPIINYYSEATKLLKKNDLDGFFDLINVPFEQIAQYAVRKAEEMNLPNEQRMHIENQRQIQKQKEYLESQNQALQEQQYAQLSEFRNQELGWVMQRPEVSAVVSAFDAKRGAGAFRQMVIQTGLAHAAATNGREDLSADQAVRKVLDMIGPFVQPNTIAGTTQGTVGVGSNQLIQQNGAPPIIPNVSSKGSSPVKKQVRSIEDLKKRREEMRNDA